MNNKGFAISTMIYALMIMFLVIVTVIITYLSSGNMMFNSIQKASMESINRKEDALPIIVVTRINEYLEIGDSFSVMAGVRAYDYNGNDITDRILISNEIIDTNVSGINVLTYTVTDDYGNTTTLERHIHVAAKTSALFSIDTSFTNIENFNNYNVTTEIEGNNLENYNSTWVTIDVTNESNNIKYFKYRISNNNGATFGEWLGIVPSLNTKRNFLLKSGSDRVLIGNGDLHMFDDNSMYASFDIRSNSTEYVDFSLYNSEFDRTTEVLASGMKTTTTSAHKEVTFGVSDLAYSSDYVKLSPTTYTNSHVFITDFELNPVDTYSILLNAPGTYVIEVLIVDQNGVETIKTSEGFTILDHTNYGPTSYKTYFTNIDSTGFDVYVTGVSDLTGISRVVGKIYTDNNGEDDLNSGWIYQSFQKVTDTTYKYRVYFGSHKNEKGLYNVEIYGVNNYINGSLLYKGSILIE